VGGRSYLYRYDRTEQSDLVQKIKRLRNDHNSMINGGTMRREALLNKIISEIISGTIKVDDIRRTKIEVALKELGFDIVNGELIKTADKEYKNDK
jgi:hypothetical protein